MDTCIDGITRETFTLGAVTFEILDLFVTTSSGSLTLTINHSISEFMQENFVLDIRGRRFAFANGALGTSAVDRQ